MDFYKILSLINFTLKILHIPIQHNICNLTKNGNSLFSRFCDMLVNVYLEENK